MEAFLRFEEVVSIVMILMVSAVVQILNIQKCDSSHLALPRQNSPSTAENLGIFLR
jgi:hypothetical protein